MTDETQTDAANLAKTGNEGNAPGPDATKTAPEVKADPPKADPPVADKPKDTVLAAHDDNSPAAVAERDRAAHHGNDIPAGRDVHRADKTERVLQQHERVDRELAERSEANQEGMDKIIAKDENQAAEAHARTEHSGDLRAGHVPTGKEVNRNTPRVLKDGTKVWDM